MAKLAGAGAALAGPMSAPAGAGWASGPAGRLAIDALSFASDATPANARRVVDAGLSAAVVDLAIWPRTAATAGADLDRWNERTTHSGAPMLLVRRAADIDTARQSGRLGLILGCQDASILGAPSENVEAALARYVDRGLRMLQLTHNDRTIFADSYTERHDGGLSRAGERLVRAMNRLGVLIDLSHCSHATLLDAVAVSDQPCIVSHAGCRALAPTARNKTDAEIRALGRAGGMFAVFNMTCWLTTAATASLDTVIDHIDHALQVIGAPQVGFGSDGALASLDARAEVARMAAVQRTNAGRPGFEWEVRHVRVPELNAPDRLTVLADGLARRRYSDQDIASIVGGAFYRLFRRICG